MMNRQGQEAGGEKPLTSSPWPLSQAPCRTRVASSHSSCAMNASALPASPTSISSPAPSPNKLLSCFNKRSQYGKPRRGRERCVCARQRYLRRLVRRGESVGGRAVGRGGG